MIERAFANFENLFYRTSDRFGRKRSIQVSVQYDLLTIATHDSTSSAQ